MGKRAARVVLVVEDYDDARTLYVRYFRNAGFEVLEATNGDEAVALARLHRPDAIVMDLQLPEVDGWEATRRIRSEVGSGTYILAASAAGSDFSRKMAFDVGCDDFVAKPITPDVLVGIVVAALRDRDASVGRAGG